MMSAATYHRTTAYQRQAMPGHRMDWTCQPATVKHYPGIDNVCAKEGERPGPAVIGELLEPGAGAPLQRLDRGAVLGLLRASYGVTAVRRTTGGVFRFRSAASAGALYPAEIYCIVHDVAGLAPGTYYFDPEETSLAHIQPWSGPPPQLTAGRPAACSLVISGIFFRSSWKYHLRAYRYLLLDAGHLTENLHLSARLAGLEHEVLYDFDDPGVGRRLGLDEQQEVPLVVIRLFADMAKQAQPASIHGKERAEPLAPEVAPSDPIAPQERIIPGLVEIHRAGSGFASETMAVSLPPVAGRVLQPWCQIPATSDATGERPFRQALVERRSCRNFVEQPMTGNAFWQLLGIVSNGLSKRCPSIYPRAETLACGFIAGGHTPLSPGYYLLAGDGRGYGLVRAGAVAGAVAAACLEQRWLAAAGLQFVFLSDPTWCDCHYGARGYRYAMLNAGRLGQLIYLGATALGLGACGIGAFFDGEIRTLLDLPEEGTPLYLVAAGPVKHRKTG